MFKRLISVLLVLVFVFLCFTGCSTAGADARIVLPLDNEPSYLDPQIVSDTSGRMILSNLMEGLMEYDSEGNLREAACESYSVSSDGKTYTFNLRKDGKWRVTSAAGTVLGEDYKETFDTRVTAQDFVFAFRRALQSETLCPFAGSLMTIKNSIDVNRGRLPSKELGVYAKDDYTFVVELKKADCDFLATTTLPCTFPCNEKYFEATGGRYGLSGSYMIYNGPFYLSNWAEGTAITIRRNNSYHSLDDKAESVIMPSSVYFSFNRDISSRAKKLKDETYHFTTLRENAIGEVEESKKVQLKNFETSELSLIFNCNDELTSNESLRRALASGLDYSVLETMGERAKSIVPSGMNLGGAPAGDRLNCKLPSTDRKLAGKLYTTALRELEMKKLEIVLLCDTNHETMARRLIQNWQSVFGIIFTVSVQSCEPEELSSRVKSGDYQMALYELDFNGELAKNSLSMFSKNDRNNIFSYHSKEFEKLLTKCFTAATPSDTVAAIKTAENVIVGDSVIVPLLKVNRYYGIYSKCSNFSFSATGEIIYFKNVLCR